MLWFAIISLFITPLQENDWYAMPAEVFFNLPEVQAPINAQNPDYQLLQAAIFQATNQARMAEGFNQLAYHSALEKAARLHSENMRKKNFFAHLTPRSHRLKTPQQRIQKYSDAFKSSAENLARYAIYKLEGKGTFFVTQDGELVDRNQKPLSPETYGRLSQKIVRGWMDSPGHRSNILGTFSHMGIGLSDVFKENKNQLPELLITQNFGLK